MNDKVIELTRQLGAAIQQDQSYLDYLKAKEANDNDEALQNDIKELNLIRIKYNSELSKPSAEQDREKIDALSKEFNEIYLRIMENKNMVAYNNSKAAIDTMMNSITGILQMCVNGEDPATCEPSSCTSDCSTCGGCH